MSAERPGDKYFVDVDDIDVMDIYEVCRRFEVDDPSGALQHAIKKLLLAGMRNGSKSKEQDVLEARASLDRYAEMYCDKMEDF